MDKPKQDADDVRDVQAVLRELDVKLMADVQAVLLELTSCSYQAKRLGRPALHYALNRAWREVQSVWQKG
jgi:hypothetical protein